MMVFILSCSVAIIVSFLCSLSEAVLLSSNSAKMHRSDEEETPSIKVWQSMKKNIGRPIAAILILNTIAHTGGATIAAGAFHEIYGERWLWLFSVVFTMVILFGTEILPKLIGVSYSDRLIPFLVKPLLWCCRLLMPVIWLSDFMAKRFHTRHENDAITAPQIVSLVNLAHSKKLIAGEQEQIIVNTMELHSNCVESIMIPREQVAFLQWESPIEEIAKIFEETKHTRYPVSSTEQLDDAFHYINVKTILPQLRGETSASWHEATKTVLKIPITMTIAELLKLFNDNKQHLALVVDAHEKVAGLVTFENVIYEILGKEHHAFVI